MKVLLITTGSRGDVEPFLALACGLRERGHLPTLAGPARFNELAAGRAVEFHSLDDSVFDLQDDLMKRGSLGALTGAAKAKTAFERFLIDVASLADHPTDVVVYHPKTLAAPMVAESQGRPAIAAQLIPLYQPTTAFPAPILPARIPRWFNRPSWATVSAIEMPWRKMLRRLRNESFRLDGAPIPMTEQIRRNGALNAWSPQLLPAPVEWQLDAAPLGFWRLPESGWSPPAALLDFLESGDPPIYIGFGSMVDKRSDMFGITIVEGLRKARRRGVVATGSGAVRLSASDDVFVLDQAPHHWLLPRVSAVVHHGGVGTLAAALHAGVPQVIKPFLGDQHFWARRASDLGVAVRLGRLTPDTLAAAITTASSLAPRARTLSRSINSDRGTEAAIARLEQIVRTG